MMAGEETTPMLGDGQQKPHGGATVTIERPAYNQRTLMAEHDIRWREAEPAGERCKTCMRGYCQCSKSCAINKLLAFFPFIKIMQNYEWRNWLLMDCISGLSVGVIHIPQSMGFALLTSVPPVYGLYSSFFPIMFYFIFGTSRHISIGTMAVISLFIGEIVNTEMANLGYPPEISQNSSQTVNETRALIQEMDSMRVGIAVSVSLMVGIYQFLMGFLGLGVVATFMSMPFVGSFLCGASVHIITSQIPPFFGLRLAGRSGLFRVPLVYYDVFRNITQTNIGALVTALICFIFLVIIKEVINTRFRVRLKVPIPAEFIVIIIGTLASHYGRFNERYGIKVIGHIPKGFPIPAVPPMTNVGNYAGTAIIIAVVSFAVSITMAKLMAKKHKYQIDVNQELYAYGLSNGLSSFFHCFAGAQAPPRTLIHDAVGGRTQLSSIVSAILIFLVIIVIAPVFKSLPNCVLSAIIISALIPIFRQFQQVPLYWRLNKYDLAVFMVTFLSVVILDVTSGLAIGIGLSIFLVVLNSHLASGSRLVSVNNSDVFIPDDSQVADSKSDIPGINVFRYNSPLFFANLEKFKAALFDKTVNPNSCNVKPCDTKNGDELVTEVLMSTEEKAQDFKDVPNSNKDIVINQVRTIILDCSGITYIDVMGISLLESLHGEYKQAGIDLVLVNCDSNLLAKLNASAAQTYSGESDVKITICPTIQDAVAIATQGQPPTAL